MAQCENSAKRKRVVSNEHEKRYRNESVEMRRLSVTKAYRHAENKRRGKMPAARQPAWRWKLACRSKISVISWRRRGGWR
jgi:hypothetical protein